MAWKTAPCPGAPDTVSDTVPPGYEGPNSLYRKASVPHRSTGTALPAGEGAGDRQTRDGPRTSPVGLEGVRQKCELMFNVNRCRRKQVSIDKHTSDQSCADRWARAPAHFPVRSRGGRKHCRAGRSSSQNSKESLRTLTPRQGGLHSAPPTPTGRTRAAPGDLLPDQTLKTLPWPPLPRLGDQGQRRQ